MRKDFLLSISGQKSSLRFAGYLKIIWYFKIYINLFHVVRNNVLRYPRLERRIYNNPPFFAIPEFTFSLEIRKKKAETYEEFNSLFLKTLKVFHMA